MRRVDNGTVTIEFTRDEVERLKEYLDATCADDGTVEAWGQEVYDFLEEECA